MDSKFLTVDEVAEQYGVDRQTVMRMITEKKFKATKFGWQWRINRDSLEAFVEAQANKVD
jgi:excisionase family DNA binding protein